MEENKYVIKEWDGGPVNGWTITESELNARWKTIRRYVYMHMDDKDLTDILLHGEMAQAPIGK
jgi:hypothetical protein